MDNKKLGIIIIVLTLFFGLILGFFKFEFEKSIKSRIRFNNQSQCIHGKGTTYGIN